MQMIHFYDTPIRHFLLTVATFRVVINMRPEWSDLKWTTQARREHLYPSMLAADVWEHIVSLFKPIQQIPHSPKAPLQIAWYKDQNED